MSFFNLVLIIIFVFFVIILVVGFNKQMIEKNEQRQEKYKKLKDKK